MDELIRPALSSLGLRIRYTAAPQRVLVVEDNLDSVRALAALVSDMGHRVEYAINGYAALELARRFRPTVVLLDLGLPAMDGYEVCRLLKKEPGLKDIRVIAVTAYGKDEHRKKAREAGCALHLVKPVAASTLFDVLEPAESEGAS